MPTDDVFGRPPIPVPPSNTPIPRLARQENIEAIQQLLSNPEVTNALPAATEEQAITAAETFGAPLTDETPTKSSQTNIASAETKKEQDEQYSGGPFDNAEFRKICDERAGAVNLDISIGEFGRVYQWVPVLPGKLEVQFCTPSGEESLWIGRRVKDTSMVGFFEWRLEDLATCIRACRGSMFGKDGIIFEDPFGLVDGKLKWREEVLLDNISKVKQLPNNVLNILLKQLEWFNARVDAAMADLRNC